MKTTLLLVFLFTFHLVNAQEMDQGEKNEHSGLPYYQIPDYPESYNACTMAARMIDGLGFRYYWATEGLREEDLAYQPSETGRSTAETLGHIYGLVKMLSNTVHKRPNVANEDEEPLSFAEKRRQTLLLLKQASDILRASAPEDIEDFKIVFERGGQRSEFPFWNHINGPIADALWHTGQLVAFRRASGNPIYPGISFFQGTVRE